MSNLLTGFRLFCCACLLLSAVPAVALTEPVTAVTVASLQQENATLQRQVKRLETQVSALRDELNAPDATQIIGGLGYIVGIFGIAGWLAARKKTGREG